MEAKKELMTSAPVAPTDLHAQIMSLPCNPTYSVDTNRIAYKMGHHDALRAAADFIASLQLPAPVAMTDEQAWGIISGEQGLEVIDWRGTKCVVIGAPSEAGNVARAILAAQPKPAPSAAAGEQVDWLECERISNEDHVDEALRTFSGDPTQDNATGVIQAAITVYSADRAALAAQPTPAQGDAVPVASKFNGLEREAAELARADQSPVKITDDELAAFHRFCDCCEDFDAGGHDVPKDMMRQLTLIGLVRAAGPNRHETTNFGDWIRDASNTGTPPTNATRQSSADAVDAVACYFKEHQLRILCAALDLFESDTDSLADNATAERMNVYLLAKADELSAIAAQGGKGGDV